MKIIPFLCKLAFTLFFTLVLAGFAISQPISQTYNTAGTHTYTVPAGYSAVVTIQAWGAGAGGNNSGFFAGGAGGGGGAYAAKTITLSPGNYTVVVGSGGSAGNPGGSSSFNGAAVVANGGTISAGGTASTGAGYTSYAGGNGAAGSAFANGGGGGGSAYSTGVGSNASGATGGAGQGNGGNGGTTFSSGANGTAPGGGGGGAGYLSTGGTGAGGLVIIIVNQALNVEFGAINASLSNNSLRLRFATLKEVNNSHFVIQISKNGKNFKDVATVQSNHADGNFSGSTDYDITVDLSNYILTGFSLFILLILGGLVQKHRWKTFVLGAICFGTIVLLASCDKNNDSVDLPDNGKMYLRIKQVDKDNNTMYSRVITVINE
ncbi:MAG: hypothetical protein ACK5NK_12115 [Niabella sp.]